MADLFKPIKTRFVSVHPDFDIKNEGPEWHQVPDRYKIPAVLKHIWAPINGKLAGRA